MAGEMLACLFLQDPPKKKQQHGVPFGFPHTSKQGGSLKTRRAHELELVLKALRFWTPAWDGSGLWRPASVLLEFCDAFGTHTHIELSAQSDNPFIAPLGALCALCGSESNK